MKHTEEERNAIFREVRAIMDLAVMLGTIDAWFFNWAPNDAKDKAEAESVVNKILPSTWRFVCIHGNGTNIGKGWFANDEYDLYLSMECFSNDEDFIDSYEVTKKEECAFGNIEE